MPLWKLLCASNRRRVKFTLPWPTIITTVFVITDGLEANWPLPDAHFLNDAEVFLYTGFIDRREGHWDEATHNFEGALEAAHLVQPLILQQLALAYHWQRRYAEEVRTYDRALTIVPADPNSRILRALVALDWRADIRPFQATLATLVAENPRVAPI